MMGCDGLATRHQVQWEVDLILQWTLGFGEADEPLLPPPDALAGLILCLWAAIVKYNQRTIKATAEEGDVVSSQSLILPYFSRVLTWSVLTHSRPCVVVVVVAAAVSAITTVF